MSSTRAGVSTFNFIRSTSVVPPARNRPSAPGSVVVASATAAVASLGRVNSKVFMDNCSVAPLCVFANFLDCGHDIGIGAAAADIAAHQFLHCRIVGTARFFEQRHGRHDL